MGQLGKRLLVAEERERGRDLVYGETRTAQPLRERLRRSPSANPRIGPGPERPLLARRGRSDGCAAPMKTWVMLESWREKRR